MQYTKTLGQAKLIAGFVSKVFGNCVQVGGHISFLVKKISQITVTGGYPLLGKLLLNVYSYSIFSLISNKRYF